MFSGAFVLQAAGATVPQSFYGRSQEGDVAGAMAPLSHVGARKGWGSRRSDRTRGPDADGYWMHVRERVGWRTDAHDVSHFANEWWRCV